MALLKRGKIWHVRAQIGGVLIAKSTKTANKRIAEQIEAKWISEVHAEVVVANRRPITVEKAIAAYLESRRGMKGWESCGIKMRLFRPFDKRMIHEVKAVEVTELALKAVDSGYSINTINVSLIYWCALQNHLTKAGYTPGHKVKQLKGGNGRVRFLLDEECTKLLEALDPKHFREKRKAQDNLDFTIMLLATGAREQEIASLKLDQIDQAAGTLTVYRSKGGTDTTYPMTNAMLEVIARRMVAAEQPLVGASLHGRVGNGYLFPERASGRTNNGWMAKAAARAGLEDVTCHVLRHTYACRMLRAGVPINDVQTLMGHKNMTTTMRYAHVIPGLAGARAKAVLDAK